MNDINETVSKHDILLNRLARRDGARQAASHLTEFGMHGHIAESEAETGILVRDMFPVSGKITHVYLRIGTIVVGEKEKKVAELMMAIESASSLTVTKGINVTEGMHDTAIELKVEAGSRLMVKCSKPMKDVWYALTIDPIPRMRGVDQPVVAEIVEVTG